jgi:hypothetical protein
MGDEKEMSIVCGSAPDDNFPAGLVKELAPKPPLPHCLSVELRFERRT